MDSGDIAWVLISAALVLFMTPGLALFYGGMDQRRNVMNMMMMSFWCLLTIPIAWVVIGYSIAGGNFDAKWFGGFDAVLLDNISLDADGASKLLTIAFLGMFAVITPALISGAVAGRMKFAAWAIFAPVWMLLVFAPVFKWVYGGWLGVRGSLDFAGGTAIHVNAGIAALVAVLILGKRRGWPKQGFIPHNMTLVMIGTGILWFGWFGFNAGSALGANAQAVQAFMNTFLAAAAAGLAWAIVERIRDGHFTNLGAASGIVAGLVAITPACGYVTSGGSIFIGLAAGVVCSFAVRLKFKAGYDDALDVVGVHFVGGLVGSLMIGLFADAEHFRAWNPEVSHMDGLFYGGGLHLLLEQAIANGATIVYSGIMTALILLALKYTVGIRVTDAQEVEGLDSVEHREAGYHMEGGLGSRLETTGA